MKGATPGRVRPRLKRQGACPWRSKWRTPASPPSPPRRSTPRPTICAAGGAPRWRQRAGPACNRRHPSPGNGTTVPQGAEQDLAAALERDGDAVIRAAFDNGLKLGEGFRRTYHLDLPLADLAALLPALGVPCLERDWRRVDGEAALLGERSGCEDGGAHPRACEYWREAVEGLILGATGAVRHARHRSVGAGDGRCVDVLHVDPRSPLRFGAIEPAIAPSLAAAVAHVRALDSRAEITVLGQSEGVVYFTSNDGAGRQLDGGAVFVRAMARRAPGVRLYELKARAVLAPDGESSGCGG